MCPAKMNAVRAEGPARAQTMRAATVGHEQVCTYQIGGIDVIDVA